MYDILSFTQNLCLSVLKCCSWSRSALLMFGSLAAAAASPESCGSSVICLVSTWLLSGKLQSLLQLKYLTTTLEICSSPAASASFNIWTNVPACSGSWRHSGSPDQIFYALKLEGQASLQFLNLMHGAAFFILPLQFWSRDYVGMGFPPLPFLHAGTVPSLESEANPSILTCSWTNPRTLISG